MAEILSDADYINLLQLRFNNPQIQFESADYQSLTENREGFSGEHNILKITYSLAGKKDTVNFFVKTKPKSPENAKMVEKLMTYEKEVFFYDKLTREFERRGYNTSFAPKIYLCTDELALIMHDIKSEGYSLPGRTVFYDLPKMKSSIKALAQFHGASLMYEEEKSVELNKKFRFDLQHPTLVAEKFLDLQDPKSIGYAFIYKSKECFQKLISLFDESEEWKKDFIDRMDSLNFYDIFNHELGFRKALGHGDLWSNNMMFKEQNGELQCCILDYQILRYFNPAFDALYIVYANTNKEFRDQHMDSLLDYYYNTLEQILQDRNLKLQDIYSKKDYESSLKYYKLMTQFEAACAHTLTFLDVAKVKEFLVDKSVGDLMGDDRPILVYEAYKHDPLFKKVLQEDLYEVRNMLVNNSL